MDAEKRIRTNESKKERTVSEHHLKVQVDTRSYLVACSAKTDQERTACCKLPPCWGWGGEGGEGSLCLAGLSTDTRGIQDNISVFQHATAFVAGLLGEWRPAKSPESCAARNGLHIYSSLSQLGFFCVFLFHFVSREVDVVDVDLVSVSGDWRWKH